MGPPPFAAAGRAPSPAGGPAARGCPWPLCTAATVEGCVAGPSGGCVPRRLCVPVRPRGLRHPPAPSALPAHAVDRGRRAAFGVDPGGCCPQYFMLSHARHLGGCVFLCDSLLVSVKRSSHYVPGAVLSAPRALNSRQFDERAILTLHTREGHKGKQFRPRVPS